MSEKDVVGAVEGAVSAAILQFKTKPKPRKPREKKPRPANDFDDGEPLDLGGYDGDELNDEYGFVVRGGRPCILRELRNVPIEDRITFIQVEAFKLLLCNKFTERRNPVDGKVKRFTHAKAWIDSPDRRTYDGIEFFPDRENGEKTPGFFNLWQGYSVVPERREGASYKVFRDHLLTNIAGGDAELFRWIWAWFAKIVQRPRERIGTALVMRGGQGSGKTKVGQVIGALFMSHYWLVDSPEYIIGKFNAHMASCLLLQADEGFWAGDKAAEGRLKGLVTSDYQMIEAKGIDAIRLRNNVHLLVSSNEGWVIPAGMDERRFAVVDVAGHVAQNAEYFAEMDAQLDAGGRELLLADLLDFDLGTVNLRQIPKTEGLLDQKLASMDPFHKWWWERLDNATTRHTEDRWERSLLRNALYADYVAFCERLAVKRKLEMPLWAKELMKVCPQIKEGRSRALGLGSDRPRSYEIPPLREARSDFEIRLGQAMTWGDADVAVDDVTYTPAF